VIPMFILSLPIRFRAFFLPIKSAFIILQRLARSINRYFINCGIPGFYSECSRLKSEEKAEAAQLHLSKRK
jgi:hypothetical protein